MAQSSSSFWQKLQQGIWRLAVAVLLLFAICVTAGRYFMTQLPEYRPRLESLLQARIDSPLTITELEGQLSGLTPQFLARRIRLPAPQGESPLVLDEVVLGVDVLGSLWHRDLVLKELRISGVDLHLVRGDEGQIRLRGLETMGGDGAALSVETLLELFYRQQQLVIENARLSLDWPGLPPLAASRLDATLVNQGDEHHLAAEITARDRPFQVSARLQLQGDAYQWSAVNGKTYLNVSGERLQEWLPSARNWPLDVTRMDGQLRLWAQIKNGELYGGQGQLQVPALTLSNGQQQWPLEQLTAKVGLRRQAGQARLSVTELSGQSPAGRLALNQVGLQWQTRGQQRAWQLRADNLSLDALTRQVQQWPFPLPPSLAPVGEQITALAPQGEISKLYLAGKAGDPQTFQARFARIRSQASGRIPGVAGLSGWLAGSPEQGLAHLQGANVQWTLPQFYGHPLASKFTGQLTWQQQDDTLKVRSGRLRAANDDAHGEALVALDMVPDQIPRLRLTADIYQGNGSRAAHYIPLRKLPEGVADWLGQAFTAGELQRGQILYQGPVKIDKRRQQDRTLQMRYRADQVELSFLPQWPSITDISADVLVNGRQVRGFAEQGQWQSSQLSQVYVDIPEFDLGEPPRLIINGKAQGPAADLDTLLQDTPLVEHLPAALSDWRFGEGTLHGNVLLNLPLKASSTPPAVIVDGDVTQATVENSPRALRLSEVSAPVYFHLQKGIQMETLKARALGGDFTGQWLTHDGISQLQLDGQMPVERARHWLGFDWLAPLSGQLPLGLNIQVPWQGKPFTLHAASSLEGVTINAPAPLGKTAQQVRPLSVTFSPQGSPQLALQYDSEIRGAFQLEPELSGEVRLGPGAPDAAGPGVRVLGRLAAASAQPWLNFIVDDIEPRLPRRDKSGSGAGGGLRNVQLQVDQLDLFGATVDNARFSALPQAGGWQLALSSKDVAGSMVIPAGFRARGNKPLQLDITRLLLSLAQSPGQNDETPPVSPKTLPPMDVTLQKARINQEDYGRWQGQVRPMDNGVRINDLEGNWRQTRIQGTLDWTAQAEGQYSRFHGSLHANKLGRALEAWGLPRMLESEQAQAKGVLGWSGWPLAPDYLALDGQAQVNIGECRIPDTDTKTSFLRLLGILNIGTIQRRLRLDFSDLYKKGLSCDSITGDFRIKEAKVATGNLAIDSPSAAIRVKGEIDLAGETLDHRMEVTLPVSSNLYAGCLAGPAACAGIFMVERIWGDKLDKTTTMEYHVTGPWSDPKVTETEGIFQ